jgi:hypothetical protein
MAEQMRAAASSSFFDVYIQNDEDKHPERAVRRPKVAKLLQEVFGNSFDYSSHLSEVIFILRNKATKPYLAAPSSEPTSICCCFHE